MAITEDVIRLAAVEAISHAIHCKRCRIHYIRILTHATKISDKIVEEMTPK